MGANVLGEVEALPAVLRREVAQQIGVERLAAAGAEGAVGEVLLALVPNPLSAATSMAPVPLAVTPLLLFGWIALLALIAAAAVMLWKRDVDSELFPIVCLLALLTGTFLYIFN